jgi:AcrR family transcriptional regulator
MSRLKFILETMKKSTRSPKTYHHGNLKNALVETAAKLIAERGASSVSLREVAREAGVSHAAPYHHFEDKNGLIAAVAEEGFHRFDTYQERALRSVPSNPRERLRALGKAYVRFALTNPHFFRVMFRNELIESENHATHSEVAKRTFDRLINIVRENLSDKNEENILQAAIHAWAFVHGLATLWLEGSLKNTLIDQKTLYVIVDQSNLFS